MNKPIMQPRREIPAGIGAKPPISELYTLLHSIQKEREGEARARAELEKKYDVILANIALSLFWSEKDTGKDALKRVQKALEDAGVQIKIYDGAPVSDVIDLVQIEGWSAGDEAVERVDETYEPEITFEGRLLHQAKVFAKRAMVIEPDVEDTAAGAVEGESGVQADEAAQAMVQETVPGQETGEMPVQKTPEGAGEEAPLGKKGEAAPAGDMHAPQAEETGVFENSEKTTPPRSVLGKMLDFFSSAFRRDKKKDEQVKVVVKMEQEDGHENE